MARIFISYSRADGVFMEQFIPVIRKVYGKENIWYDDDIHGGADWWQMILREIAKADVFIYLLSNDSLQSPYCRAELREALRLGKAILPIVIRPKTDLKLLPDDLERVIRKVQWVDLGKGTKDTTGIANLFAAINNLVQNIPSTTPAPHDPQPTPEPPVPDKPTARSILSDPMWQGIGGIVAILALVFAIYVFVVGQNSKDTPTPTPSQAVVENATHTPSNQTSSLTPSETLEIALIVATLDAQATLDQVTLSVQNTAAARATQYAAGTQGAEAATLTATRWTFTPTPNVTASIDAFRTQQAATVTQAWIDSWTPTPSDTPVPLGFPGNPVTSNAQWQFVVQEFDGVSMVLVPVGCFMMGSETGVSNETPVHEQCFEEPFWIDRYEVTNAQYGSVGCASYSSEPNQPRNCVTWFEAKAFCEERGGRLPTEREWEYAARGPDNLIYPWGDAFEADNVVYRENSNRQTAEVGSKPGGVSWVGAYDMSGNLWEWVSSIYASYPYDPTEGRENQDNTNIEYVLRGGSFNFDDSLLRGAVRFWNFPDYGLYEDGFRCARSYF